jgi:tetratricopeptide (TPR) repeat protein
VVAASGAGDLGGDDGGLFDLAAELRDVIDDERSDDDEQATSAPSTVEDGFDSIFADFKQGVSATLSEDDYETRYDLGIAYREMELYSDAIGEFQRCLQCPRRKISSLHMMGLCALDLGQPQDAVNHLQQALASEELPREQAPGIQFDLARALEAGGDKSRACAAYQAVLDVDPDFPGVAERLARLESGAGEETPSLANESQGGSFESFDDLVADANDGDPEPSAPQEEAFESFDDMLLEAEDDLSQAEHVSEEPQDEAPKRKPRRKKISFV